MIHKSADTRSTRTLNLATRVSHQTTCPDRSSIPTVIIKLDFILSFFFCLIPSSEFITDLRQTTTKYRFTR